MKQSIFCLLVSWVAAINTTVGQCANHALDFDGDNDYITLNPLPSSFAPNSDFTVQMWFRSDATGTSANFCSGTGGFRRLFCFGGSRFEVGECSGELAIYTNPGGGGPYSMGSTNIRDNKWHCMSVTRAGVNMAVWLDGGTTPYFTSTNWAGLANLNINSLRVGHYSSQTTPQNDWEGLMDDIRVWNYVLPTAQLMSCDNCPLTGTESGLVAYWNLDQGVALANNTGISIVTDPNGHNGTLTGFSLLQGSESNFVCSGIGDCSTSNCDAACSTNTVTINTGYNSATDTLGSLGTAGQLTSFWTLVQSPDNGITLPRAASIISPNPAWANQPQTAWISAYPNAGLNFNNPSPLAPYKFKNCFCVCEPTAVTINMSALADNNVAIDLATSSGTFIGDILDITSTKSAAFTTATTAVKTFQLDAGNYCLEAGLRNLSAVAMGLNIQGTVTGAGLLKSSCCGVKSFVSGQKYIDLNCDGKKNGVESGKTGWQMELVTDPGGFVLAQAVTDVFGYFSWSGIPPGNYIVREVAQPGYNITQPASGEYHITVANTFDAVGGLDFGNCTTTNCEAAFTFQQTSDCPPTIEFQAAANLPGTFIWNFGGNNAIGATTSHIFQQGGSALVTLFFLNPTCKDTVKATIPVFTPAPLEINCVGGTIEQTLPGVCFNVLPAFDPQISGGCPFYTIAQIPPPGTLVMGGEQFATQLTVTDGVGNSATCHPAIYVEDIEKPILNCPPNVTLEDEGKGFCAYDPKTFLLPTDNCEVNLSSLACSPNATVIGLGTTVVTCTVKDIYGNQSLPCSMNIICTASPVTTQPKWCGQAVVTCFSGFVGDNKLNGVAKNMPTFAIADVRDQSSATLGMNWPLGNPSRVYHNDAKWNHTTTGQVFGIAYDGQQKLYLAASTVYGDLYSMGESPFGPGGPGAIYKIDPVTETASVFANLTNTDGNGQPSEGSGLGNIAYDPDHQQFWVSNFYDGKIYRIRQNDGVVLDTYDPWAAWTAAQTNSRNFVELGERVWGIGYNQVEKKLFYSRWVGDRGRQSSKKNEIWSVSIGNVNGGAANPASAKLEIELPFHVQFSTIDGVSPDPDPLHEYSMPVSDLEFSQSGRRLLVAERSMKSDAGNPDNNQTSNPQWPYNYAHQSRLLEYELDNSDYTWKLSAGHGTPIDANLKFKVGSPFLGSNCVGGTDYGFESYDPMGLPPFPKCDSVAWSTADAMACPIFSSKMYGVQGLDANGGTTCTSVLLDLDGLTSNYAKRQFGDIDILHCHSCPPPPISCDSLMVMLQPLPGDSCCYEIDLKNRVGVLARQFRIKSATSGVTFNSASLAPGFLWGGATTSTELNVRHSSGSLPFGNTDGVARFCLGGIAGPAQQPQKFIVSWFAGSQGYKGGYLDCRDTLQTDCTAKEAEDCADLLPDSSVCDPNRPGEYFFYFKVKNKSLGATAFTATQVQLMGFAPPFSVRSCASQLPNSFPNSGINIGALAPGATSGQLCAKIVLPNALVVADSVCFNVGLTGTTNCCHSTTKECITLLPCCSPCEKRSAKVLDDGSGADFCCKKIELRNDCQTAFFQKIEVKLLTPGVTFGSHSTGGPDPALWTNPVSTPTTIQWQPVLGDFPTGNLGDLVHLCIDGIDQVNEQPQIIELRWLTVRANGKDSLACRDTFNLQCKPIIDAKCADISRLSLACLPGNTGYELSYLITNVAEPAITADWFNSQLVSPSSATLSPGGTTFATIPHVQSFLNTEFIEPGNLVTGSTVCLSFRLGQSGAGAAAWCCYEDSVFCVTVPNCTGTVTLDCCPAPDPKNLIKNGGFDGLANGNISSSTPDTEWKVSAYTPQINIAKGHNAPGSLQMWGNRAVGEAAKQLLVTSIKKDSIYNLHFWAEWSETNSGAPNLQHARVRVLATNGDIGGFRNCTACETVFLTPTMTIKDTFVEHCTEWAATADFDELIFIVENNSMANHGDSVSWARVDDICFKNTGRVPTNEPTARLSARLFPNPTSGSTRVEWGSVTFPTLIDRISIVDPLGRAVRTLAVPSGVMGIDVPVADLPPGFYWVKIGSASATLGVLKLVKQQ